MAAVAAVAAETTGAADRAACLAAWSAACAALGACAFWTRGGYLVTWHGVRSMKLLILEIM